jgi:hypothetical protein
VLKNEEIEQVDDLEVQSNIDREKRMDLHNPFDNIAATIWETRTPLA